MRRPVAVCIACCAVLLAAAPVASAAPPVRDQYIVVLETGADPATVAADQERRLGVRADFVYRHAIRGFAAHVPATRVDAVLADPRIASLAPVFPLDPIQAAKGVNRPGAGQLLPTNIDRIEADQSSTRSGDRAGALPGPAVAVMDTGIDPGHPDLDVRGGVNCAPDAATTSSWADDGGHGTHVAGTIAARDDASGVVGVAPGVPLYSVRVVKNGAGAANTTAHALCGVDWIDANAAALGIKVVNASLGYTPTFGWSGAEVGNCGVDADGRVVDALHNAICRATDRGVTFVAAMGNSTVDVRGFAPAAFDEVLAVSAIADFDGRPGAVARPTCSKTQGADDSVATFSNFTTIGNVWPNADWTHAIAAPGVCVTSDAVGGGTTVKSGTSMASPGVAGTVALCIASGHCAGLTPSQIIARLRADAFARRAAVSGYGFRGEPGAPAADGTPTDPSGSRYYGPLVYAGAY